MVHFTSVNFNVQFNYLRKKKMSTKYKSASQMFRVLILQSQSSEVEDSKMTDDEIFEAVVTQFPGLKVSRNHVAWHRSKMKVEKKIGSK